MKNKKRKAPATPMPEQKIPAPMPEQKIPARYTQYYVPDLVSARKYVGYEWKDTYEDLRLLTCNLIFLTSYDAQAMTDAFLAAIQKAVDEVTA